MAHKHKNTYTKHRNAKLKKWKKENEEKKRLTGYTTVTQQKKSVNVHSNKVLHQWILSGVPHTTEYVCTIM